MKMIDEEAVRAQAAADWRANAALRQEFGNDRAAYLAIVVAEAKGAVRIFGANTVTAPTPEEGARLAKGVHRGV